MKLRKFICNLAGLLAMAAVLALSTPLLAAAYDTWSGSFNFKVTTTDRNADGKLVKTTGYATGTVEMYLDSGPNGGPVQDPEGYYLRFIDSTEGLAVGIKGLEIVNTRLNSKSQKIMGVGAGEFFQNNAPVGPAYVSLTGKVAIDDLGNPTSITATVTTGGGSPSNGPNGGNYIWSGKPKVVLVKKAPII